MLNVCCADRLLCAVLEQAKLASSQCCAGFSAGFISLTALAQCLDVPEQHAEVRMSFVMGTSVQLCST